MNRVLELESNHTLYEQYMAQQQFLVREALKRLGEDIGRLEGVFVASRFLRIFTNLKMFLY